MSVNLIAADRFLFTSESVSEGHPDKVCDQISDAVVDALLERDSNSRVACEVAASNKGLYVLGEVTCNLNGQDLDSLVVGIVRSIVAEIGYTSLELGMDAGSVPVNVLLNPQSADIAQGVDRANPDEQGAGDQGMMFGYACRETDELMPLPITLAHRLTHRLSQVRKSGQLPFLRPDGKSQVTVEYRHGRPERVSNVVIAAQHDPDVSDDSLKEMIERHVVAAVIDDSYLDGASEILINGTGRFVDGGPGADAGLTGRKIIVDTYGGMARHGGGAFSGKDPSKVDRSGAYMSRYVAKNLVAAGLADRAEVQLAYCIGVAKPVSVNVETFGTSQLASGDLDRLVRENFDLRPQRIISGLGLRRPIYRAVAAYGHFGRPDLQLPWERTDRAGALRKAVGLT
ncbi:MAG: methionine adenosyltransferase [Chloroflexi bacterium]|nr:methionine adenosyltransferase [Chloroflexota bacterium]